MANLSSHRLLTCLAVAATGVLASCATPGKPREANKLDDKFQGYWRLVDSHTPSWWLIGQGAAINYQPTSDNKHCRFGKPNIIDSTSMEIRFDRPAIVRLSIANDQLILTILDNGARIPHVRVSPNDVCRLADGTLLDGAPHEKK